MMKINQKDPSIFQVNIDDKLLFNIKVVNNEIIFSEKVDRPNLLESIDFIISHNNIIPTRKKPIILKFNRGIIKDIVTTVAYYRNKYRWVNLHVTKDYFTDSEISELSKNCEELNLNLQLVD